MGKSPVNVTGSPLATLRRFIVIAATVRENSDLTR